MNDEIKAALEASRGLGAVRAVHRMTRTALIVPIFGVVMGAVMVAWGVYLSVVKPGTLITWGGAGILALFFAVPGALIVAWASVKGERPRLSPFGGIATSEKYMALIGSHAVAIALITLVSAIDTGLVMVVLGIDILCINYPAIRRHQQGRNGLAIRREHGFCYSFEGRITVVPWVDIEGTRYGWSVERRSLRIRRREGRSFTFEDPYLEFYESLLHAIVMESGIANRTAPPRAPRPPVGLTGLPSTRFLLPPKTIFDQRVNDILEATPDDFGEMVTIHRTNWYLAASDMIFLLVGVMFTFIGIAIGSEKPLAAMPSVVMLCVSAGVAALGAIMLLAAGLAETPPRLVLPGLSNTAEGQATIAGHCIFLLPFCLIGAWNGFAVAVGIGLDMIVCSALALWRWSHHRDGLAVLFEYGFSYAFDGVIRCIAWDEIGLLNVGQTKEGRTMSMHTRGGENLYFFDTHLDNERGLVMSIAEAVYETHRLQSMPRGL